MPVTAKLSRKFYETFGDEIANELVNWFNAVDLTYRSELRELNEINFQRFDAKLEQRIAELRSELKEDIAVLRSELKEGIAELGGELKGDMAGLRAEVKEDMAGLRSEFKAGLGDLRTELMRWTLVLWLGTLAPLAGLIIYLNGR